MTVYDKETIKRLGKLRTQILNGVDKEAILYRIKASIQGIENEKVSVHDSRSRDLYLDTLKKEYEMLETNEFDDLDFAKTNISLTITSLMIDLSGEGIDEVNRILNELY